MDSTGDPAFPGSSVRPGRSVRLGVVALVVGLIALIPAAMTAWLAAFMVCGLTACSAEYVQNGQVLLPLLATAALLATAPAVMTLGPRRRHWWLVALSVFVGVALLEGAVIALKLL